MKRKLIGSMLIVVSLFNFNVYATTQTIDVQSTVDVAPKDGMTLTIEEAVEKGLANSLSMKKVQNQAALAALISENAKKTETDIDQATQEINSATIDLENGRSTVYTSMTQLESAQAALDNGLAPQDIPVKHPATGAYLFTIPKGQNISGFLTDRGLGAFVAPITQGVQQQLDSNKAKLNNALEQLDASTQEYVSGKSKYDLSIQFAMMGVASKLSTSTISSLEPRELADLLVKMSDVQDKTTSYSINIYKNKIALLIQNNYYEAIKQEKLLAVKEKTVERAKLQYDYAQYAYEVGAKSKDDMMFAKLYYDASVMAVDLQMKEYNNAMIELKKSIDVPLDTKLNLTRVEPTLKTDFVLAQGVSSGLKTRLEMKMAEAKVQLYEDLKEAVSHSNYKENDNQYKEAKLLGEQAGIELKETTLQVESDIRKSYETVTTMAKVAETAEGLEKNAEETVEIAKLKYEVGFGASNALMKELKLEDLSGTMAEVIAAEENLASIQQKAIEAMNGYNLAKAKYLNDIGILPYK